ncbi:MAG: hypothetical protein OEZ06_09525 [Myxococcales bacterium]|nr:hypothetical protein [Myxococcales bacterium]
MRSALAPLVLLGCSAGDAGDALGTDASAAAAPDADTAAVHARFELGEGPLAQGAVPWPDDLYRDTEGVIRLEAADGRGGPLSDAMLAAQAELDGFSIRPTVYVEFDGALDADSLPVDAAASLEAGASVFLLDADTGSPRAFERVPIEARLIDDGHTLSLRPAHGRGLAPGRRYAAVVTRALRDAEGGPVGAGPRFAEVRHPNFPLQTPQLRRARELYTPVFEMLGADGLERSEIVALAVFTVQSLGRDLADARALLWEEPLVAPPTLVEVLDRAALEAVLGMPAAGSVGLDAEGGVPHEHIGWMVHGSIGSRNLLSTTPAEHGRFERNDADELRIRGDQEVPFTLWLPRRGETGALPVVLVQHGLFGERSDALALANALTAAGHAVIAVDAPFHGTRPGGSDTEARFVGLDQPDGFGDAPGDFVGSQGGSAGIVPFHPFLYRDAVRQGAVDLMSVVRTLQLGDWSELSAADPALADLELATSQLGFVGIDVGAEMGVMLASQEPAVGALVLAFAGGLAVEDWLAAPRRGELLTPLLEALGRQSPGLDASPDSPLLWRELDSWRGLSAAGSALAHASALRRLPVNVLALGAANDEVVAGGGGEALADALGAALIAGEPRYVPELPTDTLRSGNSFSGNFIVDSEAVTRAYYRFEPAGHRVLSHASDELRYEPAEQSPFELRAKPLALENPIEGALMQVAFFFESWAACERPEESSICPASVLLP